jgi:hypothetical protein
MPFAIVVFGQNYLGLKSLSTVDHGFIIDATRRLK